jgi:ATP-binding cassette subfamily C (CFTR/MRP) protein 1
LYSLLKVHMTIEAQMVQVDRCLKMKTLIQERTVDFKQTRNWLNDRPQWPEHGEVKFTNVSLRYRPDTEEVLHQLTFNVQPG